jgi:hypothetical protein
MKHLTLSTLCMGLATLMTVSTASGSSLYGDVNDDCVVDKADVSRIMSLVGTKIKFDQGDLDGDGAIGKRDYYLVRASVGSTCGTHLIGDINGDGVVGNNDLTEVLAAYGTASWAEDIDGDGKVNEIDVDMVRAQWGATFGRRLLGDVNGDNIVNIEDVSEVLAAFGRNGAADMNGDGVVGNFEVRVVNARFGMTAGQQIPGDVDGNFIVDDYDVRLIRAAGGTTLAQFDVDGNGKVDGRDSEIASDNFATIAGDALVADVNGDWVVNDSDLGLVDATWGSEYAQADLNGNGLVGSGDLSMLLGAWGNTHGQALLGDVDGNCKVNSADLELIRTAWGVDFAPADLNADGNVNIRDLSLVLAAYGNVCRKPLETVTTKPVWDGKKKPATKPAKKPGAKGGAAKEKLTKPLTGKKK